jgi:hypothetical protein
MIAARMSGVLMLITIPGRMSTLSVLRVGMHG